MTPPRAARPIEIGPARAASLRLVSPVMVAAGCAGDGSRLANVPWLAAIGAVVTHSLTLTPRRATAQPRIVEAIGGLLYDCSPANRGLNRTIDHAWRAWHTLGVPVVVSLAPEDATELRTMIEICESTEEISGIEVNLDLAAEQEPARLEELVRHTLGQSAATSTLPIMLKLPPGAGAAQAVRAAEAAGVDAVVAGHGWPAATGAQDGLAFRLGGPAIAALTLAFVEELCATASIPVIACGGVAGAAAARKYLAAGATAVQVGSLMLRNPAAAGAIARAMAVAG